MRIGLIADIHGNADALRAVLDLLRAERIDRLVCLGDVAVLGPAPGEVVRLLVDAGCAVVRGNTDAWLLDEPSDAIPPSPGPSEHILAWTKRVLAPAELDHIRGYPLTLEIELGDGKVLRCAHGSPRSFEDVIGPATPADVVRPLLGTPAAAVAAGGHTHIQMVRRIGATTVVNPGSAGLPGVGPGTEGLPINRDVDWAEFAIVEAGDAGTGVELRRVPLDVPAMVRTAERSGMPHVDWWRSRWA